MRCPTLSELPPPPEGKTGWPWTEETPPLPDRMPDGRLWPKVSIVTPSYNQGQFLEETIRSVLLQGYPDLEYIIIDGGSTDNSVEIIKKYESWLAYWVSEEDRGQSHAINKGLALSTGDIFQFINSDDIILKAAILTVASCFGKGDSFAGGLVQFGENYERLYYNSNLTPSALVAKQAVFQQPAIWHLRKFVVELGGYDESYQFVFDKEFVVRYLLKYPDVVYIDQPLVKFRLHENSKTVSLNFQFKDEHRLMIRNFIRDTRVVEISALCDLIDRQSRWRDEIFQLRTQDALGLYKVFVLFFKMLIDPQIRFNRGFFGLIREFLRIPRFW